MIALRSCFSKLLLLFLGYGALMTGVLIYVMGVSHATYHLELDQLRNLDLARQYATAHLVGGEPITAHSLAASLRHIAEINRDVDLYVLDGSGQILASSVDEPRLARHRVDLGAIRTFLGGRAALPLLGDNPIDANGRAAFSVAPFSLPGSSAAYLYVILTHREGGSAIERLNAEYTFGTDAAVMVAAALAALGASILFLRHLTRRLGVLQQDIESFRDTGFVATAPAVPVGKDSPRSRSGDEIEALRKLFLELTARVRDQMQELQKTDHSRRELLANISHDLRTPLATLRTHLETLSLGGRLTPEERSDYLAVSLQQCRRLVSLVDKLLTLAKLDAREITFSPEPFQLAELVQDVAMKWALAARRASVTIDFAPPAEGLPLVSGDVGWIERVLDCLLDNGVRYAGSGGRVTLRLTPSDSAVRVAVHDSGPGIPESKRGRVFDFLYRGDPSRSSVYAPRGDSGQAGLGLSIAQAILALHGERIDFVTAPGDTTFFFELPRADRTGSERADASRSSPEEAPRRGVAAT